MKPIRQSSIPIRVLYVDDDEMQLGMMRQFLELFDSEIELEFLSNPLKVPEKLRTNWFDCLITDFKMPEMNGIELSRIVRKESDIPIIIYTGQGSEEVAEQAYSVGISDYIRKEILPQHYQIVAKRIRDVVEKQRIERVYTSVVKDAQDAIAIVIQEKLVFANEMFIKIVGASSEKDILHTNIWKLLPGIDKKTSTEEIDDLMSGKKPFIVSDKEIKRKDRTKISVEIKTSIMDYLGKKALLYFLRDITDRKALENEIKRSEIKYRSLVELAPDGVIIIDLKGNITWINEMYSTITGFTQEEIVGKKVWSVKTVKPADIPRFLGLFLDLLRDKNVPPVEFQWLSKDGSLGWGEGRASLIKIDGKNTEVLLSLRDITERKHLEDDLRKYSKQMESLANERAIKLFEAEKMVLSGTIASTVAHDLKGPLNTILNALYLMDAKPEKANEMKQIILKSVGNANQMLEEVRKKTNYNELNYERIDIAPFIKQIINETPIADRINIKTDLHPLIVEIDALRIRRVIENLIRNAIDAIPGQGSIFVTAKGEGNKAIIEVKDSGTGIPREILDNLFTPFTSTKSNGTGLGLHYCKKTLEEHGGNIEVNSKIGSGATFTLKIPLVRQVNNKNTLAATPNIRDK